MKKWIGIGLPSVVGAVALAQVNGASLLEEFTKSLNTATTVDGNFTVQAIGGGKVEYTISLKKPNLARLDTPTQLWIADGKNITVFNKGDKTFTKIPQSDAELANLFQSDDFSVWGGFFRGNWIQPVSTRSLGKKAVNGKVVEAIEAQMDAKEGRVVTFYIDPKDKMAKKAVVELERKSSKNSFTTIIDTANVKLGGNVKADAFAFVAPEDAKEVTLEDLNSTKWLTDINEAKALAAKSNRKIFIDFYATWCGPCKKLEAECFGTDTFKNFGKQLVFCRIDVDRQPAVAKAYKIEAMPTQIVADANGTPLATKVGYANPSDFFGFLKSSL